MKSSVRFKLLPIVIAGIVVLAAVFYGVSLQTQRASMNKNALDGIHSAKETFYNLQRNDEKVLKAAITQFMSNKDFVSVFLENDREKLYRYGQDLFSKNKKLGITHFYFHREDGTVLVRLHNADKYDDRVTRKTFDKSKKTKHWGSGIELGKTAFALRVVHPYYNDNQLIGYVELGEEIDHFVEIMKEQTGHEYAIAVEKGYIDPEKWASVRDAKGLRNNYNDLPNHVIIDSTMEDTALFQKHGFAQQDLQTASDDGGIFDTFNAADRTYVAGGFSLYDAGNERVGAVVTIEDITALQETFTKSTQYMLMITIVSAILIGAMMAYVVTRVVLKPLDKVVHATTRIADGDLSAKIEVKSNDEIGSLGTMIEGLLEEKVTSLVRSTKENENLNSSIMAILRAVSQLGKGDLTTEAPVNEDITGALGDAINQMSEGIAKTLSQVNNASVQVVAGSRQARDATAQSRETVLSTVRGMNEIRTTIQETAKRIKRLGERSQEIGGIVKLIDTIAERTNVLALNANMQAAQAGEAGRGFMVVAAEVQRLAESAKEATDQIAKLISGIQVETGEAISTMDRSIEEVVEGSQLAEQGATEMNLTDEAVEALNALGAQLQDAVRAFRLPAEYIAQGDTDVSVRAAAA